MTAVTIGIPVYNGERYIEEALCSLLAQTYSNYEIIISDNASTDSTESICRSYAKRDCRIRYHRHGKNQGAAWNHNFVVHKARGRYFRWHSHDDVCMPEYLEKCVSTLDEHRDAVLAYPITTIIDGNGDTVGIYEDKLQLDEERPHDRIRHYLKQVKLCNPVLSLIRMNVLRKTGLLGSYISADKVLLLELALQGKFLEVPHKLFLRRIHEGKSTIANRTLRDRAVWFDPAHANSKMFFPVTRLFFEYIRAVMSSDILYHDKARCIIAIIHRHVRKFIKKPFHIFKRRQK